MLVNNRTSGPLRAKATGRGSQQAGVRGFFHHKSSPKRWPWCQGQDPASPAGLPEKIQDAHLHLRS